MSREQGKGVFANLAAKARKAGAEAKQAVKKIAVSGNRDSGYDSLFEQIMKPVGLDLAKISTALVVEFFECIKDRKYFIRIFKEGKEDVVQDLVPSLPDLESAGLFFLYAKYMTLLKLDTTREMRTDFLKYASSGDAESEIFLFFWRQLKDNQRANFINTILPNFHCLIITNAGEFLNTFQVMKENDCDEIFLSAIGQGIFSYLKITEDIKHFLTDNPEKRTFVRSLYNTAKKRSTEKKHENLSKLLEPWDHAWNQIDREIEMIEARYSGEKFESDIDEEEIPEEIIIEESLESKIRAPTPIVNLSAGFLREDELKLLVDQLTEEALDQVEFFSGSLASLDDTVSHLNTGLSNVQTPMAEAAAGVSEQLISLGKSDIKKEKRDKKGGKAPIPYESEKEFLKQMRRISIETEQLFTHYCNLLKQYDSQKYLTTLQEISASEKSHLECFIAVYTTLKKPELRKELITNVFPTFVDIMLFSEDDYITLYAIISPDTLPENASQDVSQEYDSRKAQLETLIKQLDNENFKYGNDRKAVLNFLKKLLTLPELVIEQLRLFVRTKLSAHLDDELSPNTKLFFLYQGYYNVISMIKKGWRDMSSEEQSTYVFSHLPVIGTEYDIFRYLWTSTMPRLQQAAEAEDSVFAVRQGGNRVIYGSLIALMLDCKNILELDFAKLRELYNDIPASSAKEMREVFVIKIAASTLSSDIKREFLKAINQLESVSLISIPKCSEPSLKLKKNERSHHATIIDDDPTAVSSSSFNEDQASKSTNLITELKTCRPVGKLTQMKEAAAAEFFEQKFLASMGGVPLSKERDVASLYFQILIKMSKSAWKDVYEKNKVGALTSAAKFLWVAKQLSPQLLSELICSVFPAHTKTIIKNTNDFKSLFNWIRENDAIDTFVKSLGASVFSYVREEKFPAHVLMLGGYLTKETTNALLKTRECSRLFALYNCYHTFLTNNTIFQTGGELDRQRFLSEPEHFSQVSHYIWQHDPSHYQDFCAAVFPTFSSIFEEHVTLAAVSMIDKARFFANMPRGGNENLYNHYFEALLKISSAHKFSKADQHLSQPDLFKKVFSYILLENREEFIRDVFSQFSKALIKNQVDFLSLIKLFNDDGVEYPPLLMSFVKNLGDTILDYATSSLFEGLAKEKDIGFRLMTPNWAGFDHTLRSKINLKLSWDHCSPILEKKHQELYEIYFNLLMTSKKDLDARLNDVFVKKDKRWYWDFFSVYKELSGEGREKLIAEVFPKFIDLVLGQKGSPEFREAVSILVGMIKDIDASFTKNFLETLSLPPHYIDYNTTDAKRKCESTIIADSTPEEDETGEAIDLEPEITASTSNSTEKLSKFSGTVVAQNTLPSRQGYHKGVQPSGLAGEEPYVMVDSDTVRRQLAEDVKNADEHNDKCNINNLIIMARGAESVDQIIKFMKDSSITYKQMIAVVGKKMLTEEEQEQVKKAWKKLISHRYLGIWGTTRPTTIRQIGSVADESYKLQRAKVILENYVRPALFGCFSCFPAPVLRFLTGHWRRTGANLKLAKEVLSLVNNAGSSIDTATKLVQEINKLKNSDQYQEKICTTGSLFRRIEFIEEMIDASLSTNQVAPSA